VLLLFLLDYFLGLNISLFSYAIVFVITGIVCLFSIRVIFERYLLSKIKLIYKVIHSSKLDAQKKSEEQLNAGVSFEQVDKEVSDWAVDTQNEIASLKTLEEYRKNYLGNISHELKTPLFSTQGFIHTLLDGGLYDENINRKYLERAGSNLDRLQAIVEDLETINNLEEGISEIDMIPFDLRALIQEVINDLAQVKKYKGFDIVFKDKLETPVMVKGDKINIYRVINNLIVNSLKYGSKEGSTRIGFYDMGETILTEISDDGIGIEAEHLNHLFDRFYRVDPSRSRKMGGSGLGLSIVKHIIEAHQQTINVRSTPGVGSTFGFTLEKV